MNHYFRYLIFILTLVLTISCSKEKKITVLKSESLEEQMIELYQEGYTAPANAASEAES